MKKIYMSLLLLVCGQVSASQTGTQIERLYPIYDAPQPGDMSEASVKYLSKVEAERHMKKREKETLDMSFSDIDERSSYAAQKAQESTQSMQFVGSQIEQLQSQLNHRRQQVEKLQNPQLTDSWVHSFLAMPYDVYIQNFQNYSGQLQELCEKLWKLRGDIQYVDDYVQWRVSENKPYNNMLSRSHLLKSQLQGMQDSIAQAVHDDFEAKVREQVPEIDKLYNCLEQAKINYQIQNERFHRYNYLHWYYGSVHVHEMMKNSVVQGAFDQVMDNALEIVSLNEARSQSAARKIQSLANRFSRWKVGQSQNKAAIMIQALARRSTACTLVDGMRSDKAIVESVSRDVFGEVADQMLKDAAFDQIELANRDVAVSQVQCVLDQAIEDVAKLLTGKGSQEEVDDALEGISDDEDDEEPVAGNKKKKKRQKKNRKRGKKKVEEPQQDVIQAVGGSSSDQQVEPKAAPSVHDLIPKDSSKLNSGVIRDVMMYKEVENFRKLQEEHPDWTGEQIQAEQKKFVEEQQRAFNGSVNEYVFINGLMQTYEQYVENVNPSDMRAVRDGLASFYATVQACTQVNVTGSTNFKTRVDNTAPDQHNKMTRNFALWLYSVRDYEGKEKDIIKSQRVAKEVIDRVQLEVDEHEKKREVDSYREKLVRLIQLKKRSAPLDDLCDRLAIVATLKSLHGKGGPLDLSFIEDSQKQKYAGLLQQPNSKLLQGAMDEIISGAFQVHGLVEKTSENKIDLLLPYVKRALNIIAIPAECQEGMARDFIVFILRQLNACKIESVDREKLLPWLEDKKLFWMHSVMLDNAYHLDAYTQDQVVAMVKMRLHLMEMLID